MAPARKRYAQVGLGGRSGMYTGALLVDFKEHCELVGFCDRNQGRMDVANRLNGEHLDKPVPTYMADEFDRMVAEQKPDVVIVTSGPDVTHSDYIVRAMELGCDVITEKPMTTDEHRCRKILETRARTGRNCQVTFNYRYAPVRSQVKEMLNDGAVGEVLSVDFTWVLNTKHGADYFRRWHRRLENSGSLLVHKSTHHFDLINWWLDDVPEEVTCSGSLRYYTPQEADRRGLRGRSDRCLTCGVSDRCPFFHDLKNTEKHKLLYLDNEDEDGYFRDRCVFAEEIDIWDTMLVSVRYRRGALLNYMLHAYCPKEGYHIAFNGREGRLEHPCLESSYISGDGTVPGEQRKGTTLLYYPEFTEPREIEARKGAGGHGGGDALLLADLLDPNPPADPLRRAANQVDGAYSILIGIAAYRSIQNGGQPIRIDDLLAGAPLGERLKRP